MAQLRMQYSINYLARAARYFAKQGRAVRPRAEAPKRRSAETGDPAESGTHGGHSGLRSQAKSGRQ